MRSAVLALLVLCGAAQAHPGELLKLRVENTLKRAQFNRYVAQGNRLVERTMVGLAKAGVEVNNAPKFGMKDAQADRMINSAKRELELLQAKSPSKGRTARIATLKTQLAEYDAMPRTGPRTSAFVLLGQEQVYLRLDRKGATPDMLANTISHEMVHIHDLPITNALWDAGVKDASRMPAYKAFLADGETRAYGEGSRVGARLGEIPFGLGQPITDSNATNHPLVQRSITRNYMRGIREAMNDKGVFASEENRALVARYLEGYRTAMPGVLATREQWKAAHPPASGLLPTLKVKLDDMKTTIARFTGTIAMMLRPPRTLDQAFAAGQADASHDLHPMTRLERMVR